MGRAVVGLHAAHLAVLPAAVRSAQRLSWRRVRPPATLVCPLPAAPSAGGGLAVVGLLFEYLALLRAAGPQRWAYDEMAAIGAMKFRFAEEQARPNPALPCGRQARLPGTGHVPGSAGLGRVHGWMGLPEAVCLHRQARNRSACVARRVSARQWACIEQHFCCEASWRAHISACNTRVMHRLGV